MRYSCLAARRGAARKDDVPHEDVIGPVVEPTYRWICTYCEATDLAESPEMARLAIDVHVSVFHAPAREAIRAHGEANGRVLGEEGYGGGLPPPPPGPVRQLPPEDRPPAPPPSGTRRLRSWWRTIRRRGR
jgi:hypothetical protein